MFWSVFPILRPLGVTVGQVCPERCFLVRMNLADRATLFNDDGGRSRKLTVSNFEDLWCN